MLCMQVELFAPLAIKIVYWKVLISLCLHVKVMAGVLPISSVFFFQ
jgi:hypothetical protein